MNDFEEIKDLNGKTYLSFEKLNFFGKNNIIGNKFDDFEIIQLIVESQNSKVYKVISKINKKIYAMEKTNLKDSKNNKNKNKIKKERILCETNNFKDPFNYTINYSKNDYKNMNLFTKYIRTDTLKVFPSTKISHNNNNKISINDNKINWALEKSKPILSKNNEKIINLNNSTSENNKNGNIKLSGNISENKDIKTKSFLLIDKRLSFKDKLVLKTKKKNMKKEIVIKHEKYIWS